MGQLMTEASAKTKWCHRLRKLDYKRYGEGAAGAAVNRDDADNFGCKAGGCGSWDWWDPETVLDSERRGYCGADSQKPNKVGNRSTLDKERKRK